MIFFIEIVLNKHNLIFRTGFQPDFKNSPCIVPVESSLSASITHIEKEKFSMWTEWSACTNEEPVRKQSQRTKYFEAVRNN